jgi:hypothetical protein
MYASIYIDENKATGESELQEREEEDNRGSSEEGSHLEAIKARTQNATRCCNLYNTTQMNEVVCFGVRRGDETCTHACYSRKEQWIQTVVDH